MFIPCLLHCAVASLALLPFRQLPPKPPPKPTNRHAAGQIQERGVSLPVVPVPEPDAPGAEPLTEVEAACAVGVCGHLGKAHVAVAPVALRCGHLVRGWGAGEGRTDTGMCSRRLTLCNECGDGGAS